MKQVLYDIVTSIVNNPDKVVIDEVIDGETTILNLHVDESDLGKVIGKQGRIAKAIRTVIKAATAKNSKPVYVEIVEDDK